MQFNKRNLLILIIIFAQLCYPALDLFGQPDSIQSRIVMLEAKQDAFQTVVDNFEAMFNAGVLFITIVAALATIIIGVVQSLINKNNNRGNEVRFTQLKENNDRTFALLKDQSQRYENFIKDQGDLNQSLLTTTERNISQITDLMSSLQQVFAFGEQARELYTQIETIRGQMEEERSREESQEKNTAQSINSKAIILCRTGINRSNYKTPENREKIRQLRNNVTSFVAEDSNRNSLLNANTYYLLALDFTVRDLYTEAVDAMNHAITLAKKHSTEAPDFYLYPVENAAPTDAMSWHKKLVNICLFHKATLLYSQGEYEQAQKLFHEAVYEYDSKDIISMLYLLESLYFEGQKSFGLIAKTYENIEAAIANNVDPRAWSDSAEVLRSKLLIKFGNCFYPFAAKKTYASETNLAQTEKLYQEAFELDQNYITKFSYAQVLSLKARRPIAPDQKEKATQRARQLYGEVLQAVKLLIGKALEDHKALCMLYYIYAICCAASGSEKESIVRYLNKVIEEAGRLASINTSLMIFSPLSKSDLTYNELSQEVAAFQKNLSLA